MFNRVENPKRHFGHRLFPFVVLGIAVSVALHAYFVATWDRYVRSIPAARMQQTGGVSPPPSMFGTTLSTNHGAVALFFAGALATLLAPSKAWLGGTVFAVAVGLTHIALWHRKGLGNLWPISFAVVFIFSAGPAMAGTTLVLLVKSWFRPKAVAR